MFIQCSEWITLLIFRSLGVGLLLGCYRLAFVICSMLLPCGVKLQSNREKCGRLKCGLFWLIVVNVGIRLVTGSVLPHTSAIDSISARQLLIQSTPIHSITQFERIPPRIPWRIPQLMLWIYYCQMIWAQYFSYPADVSCRGSAGSCRWSMASTFMSLLLIDALPINVEKRIVTNTLDGSWRIPQTKSWSDVIDNSILKSLVVEISETGWVFNSIDWLSILDMKKAEKKRGE